MPRHARLKRWDLLWFEHVNLVAQTWTGLCLQGCGEGKNELPQDKKNGFCEKVSMFPSWNNAATQKLMPWQQGKASWVFNQVNDSEICNLNSLESSSSITRLLLARAECASTDPSKAHYKGVLFTVRLGFLLSISLFIFTRRAGNQNK